jgi:hypothetical protein
VQSTVTISPWSAIPVTIILAPATMRAVQRPEEEPGKPIEEKSGHQV